MKIYIGADHNGYRLKEQIEQYLIDRGFDVDDKGDDTLNPDDDFPLFASKVVHAMQSSESSTPRGILVCGSGQGMLIAANRFKGIRAGLGWSVMAARSIRNDEDSNVLALPAEILEDGDRWKDIIDTWIATPFANATRYKRRNALLDEIAH